MRDRVRLMKELMELDGIRAAALVGGRDVLHARFDRDLDAVLALAARARTIFREVAPPLRLLELCFVQDRLVVLPMEDQMLVVSVPRDTSSLQVMARLASMLERALEDSSGRTEIRPRPAQGTDTASSRVTAKAAVSEMVQRVVGHVTQTLGGPVVRNYLRKSAEELAVPHPWLRTISVGLDGRPDLSGVDSVHPVEFARACALWMRSLLERTRAIVPAAANVDIRALAGEYTGPLEATDFFRHAEGAKS